MAHSGSREGLVVLGRTTTPDRSIALLSRSFVSATIASYIRFTCLRARKADAQRIPSAPSRVTPTDTTPSASAALASPRERLVSGTHLAFDEARCGADGVGKYMTGTPCQYQRGPLVKRIECEAEECTQTLRDDEVLCAECGHQQTTRGWALVLLLLYYPLVSLLVGLVVLMVAGLVAAGNLPIGGLPFVGFVVGGLYLWLAASVIRRYRSRQRRLEQAPEVDAFE